MGAYHTLDLEANRDVRIEKEEGWDSVALSTESGCGSVGPLGSGHYVWYIVVGCSPGAEM